MTAETIDRAAEFLTAREVAQRYRVSRQSVYDAIHAGTLAAGRVGPRSLRVRAEDAERFFRPVTVPAT